MMPGLEKYKKSPMKGADASLVSGASNIAKNKMNQTVGKKTGLETALDLGVDEANRNLKKYGSDFKVDASSYNYDSDEQIKENLDAGV
jgi:3-keto-L-gulonate-6-phosphate decarboxylase